MIIDLITAGIIILISQLTVFLSDAESGNRYKSILWTILPLIISFVGLYIGTPPILIMYFFLILTIQNVAFYREIKSDRFGVSGSRIIKLYVDVEDYNIITSNKDKILGFYSVGKKILPILIILSLISGLWLSYNQDIINNFDYNLLFIAISSLTVIIIHELGHLITMSADEDSNPIKVGILFYGGFIPLGMYVMDEFNFQNSIIASAGIYNNILMIPFIVALYLITSIQLFYVLLLVNIIIILVNSYPALYTDGGAYLTMYGEDKEYIILIVTIIMSITAFSLIIPLKQPIFVLYGLGLLYVCNILFSAYFEDSDSDDSESNDSESYKE